MYLGNLRAIYGSNKKDFRRGRGHGSGNGKTSGKGHKGQKARSGGGVRLGFEGGQMPLYRRLPKRGFNCRNSKDIVTVNLTLLNNFNNNDVVDIDALRSKGLVSNIRDGVKILGSGEIDVSLTVRVHQFSKTALSKIKAAGGKAEVI